MDLSPGIYGNDNFREYEINNNFITSRLLCQIKNRSLSFPLSNICWMNESHTHLKLSDLSQKKT